MKKTRLSLLIFLSILPGACGSSGESTPATSPAPIAEPAPPLAAEPPATVVESGLILAGTEPFWSMRLSPQGLSFVEAGGDTLHFKYLPPEAARGFQADYLRLYHLTEDDWVLLRRDSCSDGMSDRRYPYTVSLWLNNTLWSGCGRPAEE